MHWTPEQRIRVVVLGLARRDGRYLLADVPRGDGSTKGLRPLGGAVEFGETRESALAREFREELGVGVTVLGGWTAVENLFAHEGAIGHEIVFLAPVALEGAAVADVDRPVLFEDGGRPCRARWLDLRDPEVAGLDLYPTGLAALIEGGAFGDG